VNESAQKIPVDGKWTVKFQPERGAPESAQFDKLTDWTTSDVDGIKYFSGTATYSIQFEMLRDGGENFWMDLGEVCVVADVSIDGQDLGTAWTYPFRVKVPAKLLGSGKHELEVKVTNVWNNRLVGDNFLDEKNRITHTNVHGKFNKNTPLVSSGLLGPVTLEPVK